MGKLILLRHGDSEWNAKNLFTGWVDVDLTPVGERQARDAGRLLLGAGLLPDSLHTSVLTRAARTGTIVAEAIGRAWLPTARHWRLNERHYGALQGLDKRAIRARYGEEQFTLWRRSYDAAPPPAAVQDAHDLARDPRYATLPPDALPSSESLAQVTARLLPYWYDAIIPDLRTGRTVLVVGHSNSLRALVAHLDGLTGEDLLALNIPTGIPLWYELDGSFAPAVPGGRYLDPEAAEAGARAVANQGLASPEPKTAEVRSH